MLTSSINSPPSCLTCHQTEIVLTVWVLFRNRHGTSDLPKDIPVLLIAADRWQKSPISSALMKHFFFFSFLNEVIS